MLYSYYCTRAPQTRYLDYDHVKKQMYKLHAPHKGAGYISAVEFRETTDGAGQPDWEMLYTPGRRAKAEFRDSMRKARQQVERRIARPELLPAQDAGPSPVEDDPLVGRLTGLGVAEAKARELVAMHREAAEAQIAAYPYREAGRPRKNAAGWLIAAIEGNYTLPVAYLEEQQKKRQAAKTTEQRSAVETCRLCDQNGWRRIRTPEHPNGAMKRCSHDRAAEAKYPEA
jgi:hypothetical protein